MKKVQKGEPINIKLYIGMDNIFYLNVEIAEQLNKISNYFDILLNSLKRDYLE
jgi:hypothetical protein